MRTMLAVLSLLLMTAACGTESDESSPGDDGHGIPEAPDQTLAGPTWKLTAVSDGGSSKPVPRGTSASLAVTEQQVEVDTGCNSGGGRVVVDDDTITFKRMMTTLRACADKGPRETEEAFVDVVRGTVDYTIEGDTLTLERKGKALEFTAS